MSKIEQYKITNYMSACKIVRKLKFLFRISVNSYEINLYTPQDQLASMVI